MFVIKNDNWPWSFHVLMCNKDLITSLRAVDRELIDMRVCLYALVLSRLNVD